MGYTIRVSLAGYNALTSSDPDEYALYADSNWILIKEKNRGSTSVGATSTETISHNLGYVPFFAIFAAGQWVYGNNFYGDFKAYATTTTLVLQNESGGAITFKWYIFYDQQI